MVLGKQVRAANAARDAVVPAGKARIDDLLAWLGRGENLPSGKSGFENPINLVPLIASFDARAALLARISSVA